MTADFKAKKLTEFVPETERVEPKVEYKVYNERQVGMEFDVEWQNPLSAATLMIHVITLLIVDGGYWVQLFCSTLQIMLIGSPSQRWQKK